MRKGAQAMTVMMALAMSGAAAQNTAGSRYNVDPDLDTYPQKTAKECLESVVKAIGGGQIDYLLAQLADPQFVDMRVQSLGSFKELVRETTTRFAEDPAAVQELRRFLKDGQWEDGEETSVVKLKDVKNRAVFLRKLKDRWYLENRQK
jgi:hypothetical protein